MRAWCGINTAAVATTVVAVGRMGYSVCHSPVLDQLSGTLLVSVMKDLVTASLKCLQVRERVASYEVDVFCRHFVLNVISYNAG